MAFFARCFATFADVSGNVLVGATVSVYQPGTTTPVAGTLYSDSALSQTLANPLTTDSNGSVLFYMAAGQDVDLKVTSPNYSRTFSNVAVLPDPAAVSTAMQGGTSSHVWTSNGGSTPAGWSAITLAVIGPTFATSTTTMTNVDTWYTGATLGSALASGGSYLLKGCIRVSCTTTDLVSFRLYDSTNSVEILSTLQIAANGVAGYMLSCEYTGYSGTPTIVIQANNHTSGGGSIQVTATNGAANKNTFISGLRYA